MPRRLTLAELDAGLPDILAAPADSGILRAIVIRPSSGRRRDLQTCAISLAPGAHGGHRARGCWKSSEDGSPHPDVQIWLMNAR